jgi:hypothetical protein
MRGKICFAIYQASFFSAVIMCLVQSTTPRTQLRLVGELARMLIIGVFTIVALFLKMLIPQVSTLGKNISRASF